MFKRIGLLAIILIGIVIMAACSHKETRSPKTASAQCSTASGQCVDSSGGTGKHVAVHGGSLNAIVTCENGHAEVKIDGSTMQLWFVGGGPNTDKSVRVKDKSISVQVVIPGIAGKKTLVLEPKPLELAGEKIGDCSYFEGTAPWLKGIKAFTGTGTLEYTGTKSPLRIEYPKGYDPD